MKLQNTAVQQVKILDELIDNAIGLPIGSQDLLLMMAKAMRRTRDCMTQQNAEQPHKSPENHPA